MWVNAWGDEFETQEDAIQDFIIEYMTDKDLMDELEYKLTTRDLLDFIFNNELIFSKFEYEFGDEIDSAEYDLAMSNIEEIDEGE